MLKLTKGHGGYYACETCHVEGVYSSKMSYPDMDAQLRCDEFTGDVELSEHIQGTSCLLNFVLDSMHLVYLGVVRKLMNL
jgi:hypothetical protein